MVDKYEEWLTRRINMLKELLYSPYGTSFYGNGAMEQAFAKYETYKECLDKYKEEKNDR